MADEQPAYGLRNEPQRFVDVLCWRSFVTQFYELLKQVS